MAAATDEHPWSKTPASSWSTSTTEGDTASVTRVVEYPEKIRTWQGVRDSLSGNLEDIENFFMELQAAGFALCVQRMTLGKDYFDGVASEEASDDELLNCGGNPHVIPAVGYLSQILVAAQQCHSVWGRVNHLQEDAEYTSQTYVEHDTGFHLVVRFLFNGKRVFVCVNDMGGERYISIGARAE